MRANAVYQLEEYRVQPASTAIFGRDNGAAGVDVGRTHH
jgi:hypothetical protein